MGLDRASGLNIETDNPDKRKPKRDHSNNPAARKKPHGNGSGAGSDRKPAPKGPGKPSGSWPRNNNKKQSSQKQN
jgi:hypothetical protein